MIAEKKYWHELTEAEMQTALDTMDWKQISEAFLPPDWCRYKDPLLGKAGCWSLTSHLRPYISKDFCKYCEFCKEATGNGQD